MLQRIFLLYAFMLPCFGFSQESPMKADDYFSLAKSIAYPEAYAYTTITDIVYPPSGRYTDSGIAIIDHGRLYMHTISETALNGNIGTLNLDHENKVAVFSPSDSVVKEIKVKFPGLYDDWNDYEELRPYLEKKPNANTLYTKEQEDFIRNNCDILQKKENGRTEINVRARSKTTGFFISGKIVLNEKGNLLEATTVYREVYSRDISGGNKYRIVTQKNTGYRYSAVPPIPLRLHDIIEFKNWKIKLKKYTDYKLDVL